MDETYTKTFDDLEHKAGRRHEATHKVELMAVVTNIATGNIVSNKHVDLDLNDGNLGTLSDATDQYFEAGVKRTTRASGASGAKKSGRAKPSGSGGGGGGSKTKNSAPAPTTGEAALNKAARVWVQENRPDLGVSDRGRLSNEALDAYKSANPNWEKEFLLDQADDSAPAAPAQVAPAEEPVAQAAPVPKDEHGWEQEPDTTYAGTYS